jgi:hypothetical protein
MVMAEEGPGEAFERVPVQIYPDGRLDRENAARYLGRTPRTLEMWAWRRKGPQPHNIGGRVYYFLRDLDNYIAAECGRSSAQRKRRTRAARR